MIASAFGVLFDGFAYGMLLFLLSVGLSVTLGMMNFVNLAHCSFAMLGGFVTVSLTNDLGWPFLASLPLAFLSAALVSIALERVLYRRLLIGASIVITVVLVAALEYTRFGAKVRAAVDNQRMARGLGIDVDRVFAVTFALGIEIVGLDHAFDFTYLIYVLIVVAVGGLGSIGGSFVAASLLGISDMAGKYYFPELGAFLIYFVMVALLMWRPVGLFGRR